MSNAKIVFLAGLVCGVAIWGWLVVKHEEPASKAPAVAAPVPDCSGQITDLKATLKALQDQVKNVPATITDADGRKTPNPLFEQLMLQIIDVTIQTREAEAGCGP